MHRGHVSVPGSLPPAEAARTMSARHVHAVLVDDDHGGPLGWVTTRGLLHNLPCDWDDATVREAITEPVASVLPTASVADAITALLASDASHVLIRTEDGHVRGVVAESDLLKLLAGPLPT